MQLLPQSDLWQPCDLDLKDGGCLPYIDAGSVNFYVAGQVTELQVVECDGTDTVIDLETTDYVIAEDSNGSIYTYITNIPLPEGLTCFRFMVTVGEAELFSECYTMISSCTKRNYFSISSEFAKYDCLGRWYGTPQNVIAGNADLLFTNLTYIWGKVHRNASNFEFEKFKTCIVTKAKQTINFTGTAQSIPPYVVEPVEAILMRGIVTIDGETYAVQSGQHFERIEGYCRSQWDMRLQLTDCDCEINHECDLDFIGQLNCSIELETECVTDFTTSYNMGTVVITRTGNNVKFAFSDNPSALDFFDALTCAAEYNSLIVYTITDIYQFFGFFVSSIAIVGNDVSFDYTFQIPSMNACNLGDLFVDNDQMPDGFAAGSQSIIAVCSGLALLYTVTITGTTTPTITWSTNTPSFTTISETQIKIPITTTLINLISDVGVTVTATSDECGVMTATSDLNIDPLVNYRFMAAAISVVWDRVTRVLDLTEAVYELNTTAINYSWSILPLPGGTPYSGGDPTTGSGTAFQLTNIGLLDDFVIRLVATDIHGNTTSCNYPFIQDDRLGTDEDSILFVGVVSATVSGAEITITPAGNAAYYSDPVPLVPPPFITDEIGLDADFDNVYEQTTPAALPIPFIHDYLVTGTYTGRLALSTTLGVYPALPFGLIRCEYVLQLY